MREAAPGLKRDVVRGVFGGCQWWLRSRVTPSRQATNCTTTHVGTSKQDNINDAFAPAHKVNKNKSNLRYLRYGDIHLRSCRCHPQAFVVLLNLQADMLLPIEYAGDNQHAAYIKPLLIPQPPHLASCHTAS